MKNEKHKIYSQLTEEDKEKIIAFYHDRPELKQVDVAKAMNISTNALRTLLKERGINAHRRRKYTLNEDYFESIDSPQKAYLLGYLFADGFVSKDKNAIVLSSIDKELIEFFLKETECNAPIHENRNSGYGSKKISYTLNISSKKMKCDLANNGMIFGKHLRTKHLPKIEKPLIYQFIRGYAEADGSILIGMTTTRFKERVYHYETCTWCVIGQRSFLKDIADVLEIPLHLKASHTDGLFYLRIGGKSAIRDIYNILYKTYDFGIDRKINAIKNYVSSLSAIRQ